MPRLMAVVLMVLAASLTACSSSSSPPQVKAFSSSQTQRFDELVQAAIGIHRLPGVVVSIDDPRRGTFAKAYGTADVVAGRKLQLNDRYRVYSVTKTFTATAIAGGGRVISARVSSPFVSQTLRTSCRRSRRTWRS